MNPLLTNFRKPRFNARNERCDAPAFSKLRTPHSVLRTGFTLIELLVVIAIIGLLAALIVGGASLANAHKAKARVTTERDALVTAIERYKKDKGYYPPDNTNDPTCVQTPLFYELTGIKVISGGNGPTAFQSSITGESLTPTQVSTLFPGLTGFINASGDPSNPAKNFYSGIKSSQYLLVTSGGNTYTVMGVPISGPLNLYPAPAAASGLHYINPWHYNYSHPTHNRDTFDLWMDVQYGGKTNRISNWSAEPQPL